MKIIIDNTIISILKGVCDLLGVSSIISRIFGNLSEEYTVILHEILSMISNVIRIYAIQWFMNGQKSVEITWIVIEIVIICLIGKRVWFFESEEDAAPQFYLNFKRNVSKKYDQFVDLEVKLYLKVIDIIEYTINEVKLYFY